MSNMADAITLWDQVSTTDPETTKRVNQRGGFTAIDAQAQLRRATELFGPYGHQWGLSGLRFEYIYGPDGNIMELALTAEFYYPNGPEGGRFEMSNDMKYRPGDECRKKLITDLRSKCLSTLGFNSDVFEGRFDDNRYVQSLKHDKEMDDKFDRALAALHEADSTEKVEYIREHYQKIGFDDTQIKQLDASCQVARGKFAVEQQ